MPETKTKGTAIDQLVVSITKRQEKILNQDKELQDSQRESALKLYQHLIVDVIEEDWPGVVFDRLLETLFIAHDAMTNRLTLDEVNAKQ